MTGKMPPRPGGGSSASVSVTDDANVPVLVEVNGSVEALSVEDALGLAGRIIATVECHLRGNR